MPTEYLILIAFTALLVKHFIFDFYYQPPYQWKNKGTYGHPGGILHAVQHTVPSAVIFASLGVNTVAISMLAVFEFFAHYHIDWAKMNINSKYGWGANTHEQFWQLLGLDQLAHHICYALMIYWAFLA